MLRRDGVKENTLTINDTFSLKVFKTDTQNLTEERSTLISDFCLA